MKNRSLLISAYVLISAILALGPSIVKADVQVYDKNNQYLGILLDLNNQYLSVFIPSLDAGWFIETDSQGQCDYTVFESNNCTGTPYAEMEYPLPYLYDLSHSPHASFYKPDNSKKTFTPASNYDSDCQCQIGTQPNDEYYSLTQVQAPFTTPIALPLRFEVQTQTTVDILPFPVVVPRNR